MRAWQSMSRHLFFLLRAAGRPGLVGGQPRTRATPSSPCLTRCLRLRAAPTAEGPAGASFWEALLRDKFEGMQELEQAQLGRGRRERKKASLGVWRVVLVGRHNVVA